MRRFVLGRDEKVFGSWMKKFFVDDDEVVVDDHE